MTERKRPKHAEEFGPCAICGKVAMPMYGEFLCSKHGTLKYAEKAKRNHE